MIQNNIIAKALLATGFYSNRKTKKKILFGWFKKCTFLSDETLAKFTCL